MTIAGNQRGQRWDRDDYPTDPAWVKVLCDHVTLPGPIWEPAAGKMQMSSALAKYSGQPVISSDITMGENFLINKPPMAIQSIVTNPPYSLLDEFIARALMWDPKVVAMLVGLHFLGGAGRYRRIYQAQARPPTRVIIVPERMKVHGKASQFNHAWLIWDTRRAPGGTQLIWRSIQDV